MISSGAREAGLTVYRIIMFCLIAPVLRLTTLWRVWRGTEPGAAWLERRGFSAAPNASDRIWLHGASNGELTSARWLIDALLVARPDLHILVTANTATARTLVRNWGLNRVTAAFAPIDSRRAVNRVLAEWRPRAFLTLEAEFWPERITQAVQALVPVLIIGARISDRSAKKWAYFSFLLRPVLQRVAFVSAQDQQSLRHLLHLGLPAGVVGPELNLKALAIAPTRPAPFATPTIRARCLLAASTHDGEDGLILDAFGAARAAAQFDFLILAPRHPRRAAAIEQDITRRGFAYARRGLGQVPGPQTCVYLADTMGEMDHWYGMAGACVIGGSFVPKGGHTPWEPARQGCAMLHGPSVFNFAPAFLELDAAGAAVSCQNGSELAAALSGLDPIRQDQMALAARSHLDAQKFQIKATAAGLVADILKLAEI